MNISLKKASLAVAAVLAMASANAATDLVANGNFGTGTFEGWTRFGAQDSVRIESITSYDYAYFGQIKNTGGISQVLNTVANTTYNLSFLMRNAALGATPNLAQVSWGGQTVLSLANAAPDNMTVYNYKLTATSALTELKFTFMNRDAGWHITNISALAAVPEPETYAMLLAGLGVMGAIARRKSKAKNRNEELEATPA